ncbi:Fur family transcriptional regulator, zinc uptake regulator [Rhodospira trueperi]|uniref:Fur family transcriptional regulator, zinc uptake regulator n=1 Tax=Rhodospira trueperi TaxID=69960 RepID=A0A1G7EG90_9PROT|nr:Fur family transcriptional regulator, zinc uptake regulator [Rhodospira trueperi]
MRNRRLAPNHVLVFDALKKAGRPVTAYQLIDAVRGAGISAPPTVYRALNRLISDGLVHKLESTNAFVACAQPHTGGSVAVFTICDTCGNASEFTDETVSEQLAKRALERGFALDKAVVELHGTCATCANSPAQTG